MTSFKGKSILVTGSTGLIGYNLVCCLLKEGAAKVYATGRSMKKLCLTFKDHHSDALELIEHDAALPLPTFLKDLDYIFHAAGPMERSVVLNYPVSVILPNILGTINVLEFLLSQENKTGKKGRAIIFSSVTVYNNPTKDDYIAVEDETGFTQSLDAATACYSESKRMSEVIAKSYVKQYGVDAVIARFSTVYGPARNIPDTAFYEFVKKAMAGETITVNSNAAPRRDNIYVEDAINGLLALTLHGISGESYNVSSNGELGNFAAVDEIAQVTAVVAAKGSIVHCNNIVESNKAGLKLDNFKLKQLNWQVRNSMEEGIAKTMENICVDITK